MNVLTLDVKNVLATYTLGGPLRHTYWPPRVSCGVGRLLLDSRDAHPLRRTQRVGFSHLISALEECEPKFKDPSLAAQGWATSPTCGLLRISILQILIEKRDLSCREIF